MKSTPIFKLLGIAVLAAAVLYFAVQGYRYFSDPVTTTPVYTAQSEETLALDGWIVREEEVFTSDANTLRHALEEGERVGVGQAIAVCYNDASALDTVDRIEALQLKLQQLEFAKSTYLDRDAVLKLDTAITEELLQLRCEVVGGDYSGVADNATALKADILKRDNGYTSEEEIEADIESVQKEIRSLQDKLQGSKTITAQRSGTYAAVCDGYETVLTPEMLEDLTPAKLASLKPVQSGASIGKLIYGDRWRYAVTLSEDDARALKDRGKVTVRFAKGLNTDIAMTVESLGTVENGQRVVVLRCDKYMAQTTQLRHQTAEVIRKTYSGLHIPANALRVNEDGVAGVYCVVGVTARFKAVSVIYQGDGYALVEPSNSAYSDYTDPDGVRILRPGDEVIVTSGTLYDGMVVG